MLRLVTRRLIISIPLLFLVSALSFVLVSLTPGDAARTILGFNGNQAQYLQLRRQMGLDKPVFVPYWNWLSHTVRGDLGTSLLNNQPVTQALNERLQPTLSLILLATLL